MKKIITCTMFLAMLALSGLAHAGERAGAFSFSPYVGGYSFDEEQALRRNRMVYGLRLGYDWTDSFATELVGNYINAEEFPGGHDRSTWSYRLDFLYNFMPQAAMVPYIAAGAGGIHFEYPKNQTGDLSEVTANVGGGVKFFMTDSIALRADARYLWDFSNENWRHEAFNNIEYSLGFTFLFGGARPAAASAAETTPAPAERAPAQPAAEQPATGAPAGEAPLGPVPAAEPTPGHYKYCVTMNIEFDIDRANVRPEYREQVAKVGNFMKKYPTTTAVIEGHTDNVGTYNHNMELSQQRAENVVSYLVDNFGIDRSRLTAKGYGFTRPVADNSTEAGKQKNRRIEAIIDCAFDVQQIQPAERLCMSLVIDFDSGKSEVKPQYRDEIAKVADYMKQYPTTTAVIEGHTDNVGSPENNMRLSQQRAENVVRYLVENFGIDRSRLSAKGYGATRRISYNNTPEGRAQNRRINAVIDCVVR
ncbi:membrane protein [Geomonas silvestris]|uniref:Membrane protein n=1 Tax=Geomonas silvestris TaxID=2740184 RepID=A0A6V8MIM6_9BACT|nr:OmpA family protein [Geomonas silvestris]GFO59529.1 membrane protein [Geomonas silvestris]